MRIIGLAGLERLRQDHAADQGDPAPGRARRATVSTLKHAHHGFDVDQPGKDSHTHRMAGATEVLIGSGKRLALMHELRGAPEPTLAGAARQALAGRSGAGRGLQARAASQARGASRRRSASRCCIRTIRCIVAIASDAAAAAGTSCRWSALDDIERDRRRPASCDAAPLERVLARCGAR